MIEYRDVLEIDIKKLTSIMEVSFNNDSQRYIKLNKGPYGYHDGSLLRRLLKDKKVINRIIIYNGMIVGSYSIRLNGYIELLYIDVKYQNKGIATQVIKDIEAKYYNIKHYLVELVAYSSHSHYFFAKCGFRKLRDECCDDECLSIYTKD